MKQAADSEDRDGFAAWAALPWGIELDWIFPSRIRGRS